MTLAVLRNHRSFDPSSPRRLLISMLLLGAVICFYLPRMIETPQILPWNETPSKSTPVGVRTVLGTTGRWLRPVSQSCSARIWGPKWSGESSARRSIDVESLLLVLVAWKHVVEMIEHPLRRPR